MRRPAVTVGAAQSITVGANQDASGGGVTFQDDWGDPRPGQPAGINEMSMDDTAGADSATGGGDVTLKGSKIKEN